MKHLKRYNESIDHDDFNELKEFTENCLVYLLDEGFQIEFVDPQGDPYGDRQEFWASLNTELTLWIYLYGPTNDEGDNRNFSWQEVKDYYIPFIQLLKNRYELFNDQIRFKVQTGRRFDEHSFMDYKIEEVINDSIPLNEDNIFTLSVKIGGKI